MQERLGLPEDAPRFTPAVRIRPARLLLRAARVALLYMPSLALVALGIFLLVHERRHMPLPAAEPPPSPDQSGT